MKICKCGSSPHDVTCRCHELRKKSISKDEIDFINDFNKLVHYFAVENRLVKENIETSKKQNKTQENNSTSCVSTCSLNKTTDLKIKNLEEQLARANNLINEKQNEINILSEKLRAFHEKFNQLTKVLFK